MKPSTPIDRAAKPRQARVLAISVTRTGFEWALTNLCGSTPAPGETHETWKALLSTERPYPRFAGEPPVHR